MQDPQPSRNLLKTGLIGTGVTAVCCFTPVLVVTLGALGLAGVTAYLDFVLLPLLGLFVALTGFALLSRRSRT